MDAFYFYRLLRDRAPRMARFSFELALMKCFPLARGSGLRVEELGPMRAVLSMPVNRRTRNHVGTLYCGAQMTLADLAVGALFLPRFPLDEYVLLLSQVEIDFVSSSERRVEAVCELEPEQARALVAFEQGDTQKFVQWIRFSLRDERERLVTEGRVKLYLRHRSTDRLRQCLCRSSADRAQEDDSAQGSQRGDSLPDARWFGSRVA